MVAGTDQIHPNIIARPVGRESVLTVVGPWGGREGTMVFRYWDTESWIRYGWP